MSIADIVIDGLMWIGAIGLCVIVTVLLLLFLTLRASLTTDDKIKELESAHHNQSQAETNQRLGLAWKGKAAGFGTPESERINRELMELDRKHQKAWNARTNEINKLRFPVSDEEYAALDAEIAERAKRKGQ
jgi:hypothetical protein